MRCLILMRGLNVGGKNKVAMADLRSYAEGLGFARVSTYSSSGNLLVETGLDAAAAACAVESGFEERFGLAARAAAVGADAFRAEMASLPGWWHEDYARKHALFFLPGADAEHIWQRVGTYRLLEHEHLYRGSLALFWGVRYRSAISRSSFGRHLMGESFYQDLTIRSANACGKLVQLL